MTLRELAKKISYTLLGSDIDPTTSDLAEIESLLAEALEEAKDAGMLEYIKDNHKPHAVIKAEVYEECAKIADDRRDDRDQSIPSDIADKIRQRAKEVGKIG